MNSDSVRVMLEKAKQAIRSQVPDQGYLMWIDPLVALRLDDDSIVLGCPNPFSKKWVAGHYGSLLRAVFKDLAKKPMDIVIEVAKQTALAPEPEPRQVCLPSFDIRPSAGRLLNRDFTFDRFVVGDCNDFAYSAALSMASRRSKLQAPLFLLSKTGLGKSHLSQAVGHHIIKDSPKDRVYYITAEDFTNEMVHSLHSGKIARFKEKYRRKCDTLILEDIHFFSGKTRTQEELAFTLDSLMEAHKRLIFTSSYLPAEIPKLNDSVRSRLNAGIISNLEPPDFRMRMRILRKKALQNGVAIPIDIVEYLASELTGDVRQLESGLNGVAARSNLLGCSIDMEMARAVVKNIAKNENSLTLGSIKKMVCRYYRVTDEDMRGKSRKQSVVRPRQVAMYLGRRYTDQSLQAIGRSFNRYHATALHSVGVIERHLRENGELKEPVKFLCNRLETGDF